jgi:DnaJ-class molecular chaperone
MSNGVSVPFSSPSEKKVCPDCLGFGYLYIPRDTHPLALAGGILRRTVKTCDRCHGKGMFRLHET